MTVVDELLRRNEAFANRQFRGDLRMVPAWRTTIIGCADPRVDPTHIFGLEPGDVAVIRNVGGRVFPSTLQTLGMIRTISRQMGNEVGSGWNLVVLHHTDCGIGCLAHGPGLLTRHFGVEPSSLAALCIEDPRESVKVDVAALRSNPDIPPGLVVSGLIYDVHTGAAEVVVPAEPVRS